MTTKSTPAPIVTPKHFIPATEPKDRAFSPMLQGTGTNKLAQISTRTTAPGVDVITGVATISDGGGYTLKIDNFAATKGIRPSTHKLLNACIISMTEQNHYKGKGEVNTIVSIRLTEYARLLGKPQTKSSLNKLRERVKEDLETLFLCRLTWAETKGNKEENFSDIRIFSSKEIRNGVIRVGFAPELAQYLIGAYIMNFPLALFRVDERNPNTLTIGKKLSLHRGIYNNQKRGTANIISVKALLEECKQTLPSYEEVMNSDKHVGDRIMKPFEDALNSLDFITWEYSNSKGAPLTDDQLLNMAYATFAKLYIKFDINDYPTQATPLSPPTSNKKEMESAAHE